MHQKELITEKTYELLLNLSQRVENLEATRSSGSASGGSKRPRASTDSDVESENEEEPRDKRPRT